MKSILKFFGIIVFFSATGWILTYPYDIKIKADKNIVLIEDTQDLKTLKDIIKHPSLQNNLLYIVVWDPSDEKIVTWASGSKYFASVNKKLMELNKLKDEKNYDNKSLEKLKNYTRYQQKHIVENSIDFNDYVSGLSKLHNDYKDKKVKLVLVDYPDKKSEEKVYNIMKWKYFINKNPVKGTHFLAYKELIKNIREQIKDKDEHLFFPYCLLVDTSGKIIDYNAPPVFLKQELLYKQLDSLL